MQREYDVIVIGAGPAGEIAAGRLAEHGKHAWIGKIRNHVAFWGTVQVTVD